MHLKTAETKKREALLEAKEENLKAKMILKERPKKEERRFSAMKNVCWVKRKLWTRN